MFNFFKKKETVKELKAVTNGKVIPILSLIHIYRKAGLPR